MTASVTASVRPARPSRPGAGARRHWVVLAPLASLVVLVVALLEGPRLLGTSWLAEVLPQWPIESVQVTGDLQQVSREELSAAINGSLRGDFFRVDVGAVRAVALALPWVEEVAVRKLWPGKLHVQVREREAAARWAQGGLLDASGERFHPRGGIGLEALPLLSGPPSSEQRLLARHRALSSALAPLGLAVRELELDPRSGWRLRLGDELTLMLGHDVDAGRLERLAARLPGVLGERLAQAEVIDLRYANGFAVRWRGGVEMAGATAPVVGNR